MKTEYEIRVLEINKEEMIKRLEELGATKKGEYNQKRYVYDVKPVNENKWIRLRTNGDKTTLTLKEITANTVDGTKEIEFEVSSMEAANEFLHELGFDYRNYKCNSSGFFEHAGYQGNVLQDPSGNWYTDKRRRRHCKNYGSSVYRCRRNSFKYKQDFSEYSECYIPYPQSGKLY